MFSENCLKPSWLKDQIVVQALDLIRIHLLNNWDGSEGACHTLYMNGTSRGTSLPWLTDELVSDLTFRLDRQGWLLTREKDRGDRFELTLKSFTEETVD